MGRQGQGKNTYKLIYEFNQDSSLFARLAASEIEDKNYREAIELLEKGIKKFPSYPTAKLIYAVALAYQGKIKEAKSAVESVRGLYNCESTAQFYLNKIDEIDRDQNSISGSARFSFVPGSFNDDNDVFENRLGSIAEELKNAKIKIDTSIAGDITPKPEEAPSKQIVSETMARIYESQGKFGEAILIYEELVIAEPEKSEYFIGKIEQIKNRQGN